MANKKVKLEMDGYTIIKEVIPQYDYMNDKEIMQQAYLEECRDNCRGGSIDLLYSSVEND
jgi:hypothetical protein